MDGLIRFIERIIQGIVGGIQPLIDNGNLGYLIPFLMLVVVTVMALTSKNRMSLAGYLMGWVIAVSVMALYQQSSGDRLFDNLLGTIPRNELLTPGLVGVVVGFGFLFPFIQMKLLDAQPIIVAFVTTFAVMMLFLSWRASASIVVISTSGLEELVAYRRRYVGIFALWFGVGVLLHTMISAANPPKPPPAPAKKD
ncbi:MAG: hypothetical protein K8L97_06930 [Anaerolineae bacterium]|nr:hypothetical protein [Anaerolineae bacterium]